MVKTMKRNMGFDCYIANNCVGVTKILVVICFTQSFNFMS